MSATLACEDAMREKGFTLVELLIATVILSVGLLAVGAMQIGYLKENDSGRDITATSTTAEERVEELIQINWADLPAVNGTQVFESTEDNIPYTLTVLVFEDLHAPNTRTVRVMVDYNSTAAGTMVTQEGGNIRWGKRVQYERVIPRIM
ncbi:MAG: prepilin-type N-terminal cleavage/methylation domain-containing protein [Deltaproteobacteria bacterium]|nr:prepilin-type N-terminal cleavage/methylation domain-containing protein [Deltaproteobacteria bacterium]